MAYFLILTKYSLKIYNKKAMKVNFNDNRAFFFFKLTNYL